MNGKNLFLIYGIVSTFLIGLVIWWMTTQSGQPDEPVVVSKELLWGGGIALLDLLLTVLLFILFMVLQLQQSRTNWLVYFFLLCILPVSVAMSLFLARHYAMRVQKQ